MIQKGESFGYVEMICDSCSFSDSFEAANFREAYERAKEEGWRCHKKDDEFLDSCPACVEAWREKQNAN